MRSKVRKEFVQVRDGRGGEASLQVLGLNVTGRREMEPGERLKAR